MSSLVFLCQNVIRLPASFAPAVCQSSLQCKSDGLEGFGCHDSPLRVHEHPHQIDGSTARSTGAPRSQPAPRTAAADQSYSRKSSLLSQVRLKRAVYSFMAHCQALKPPLCSYSQCPFSWPVWGATQDGCRSVAGDWGSTLPPSESGLPGNGRLAEEILLQDVPVKAQWNTHAWPPNTSRGASGAWHTLTHTYIKNTGTFDLSWLKYLENLFSQSPFYSEWWIHTWTQEFRLFQVRYFCVVRLCSSQWFLVLEKLVFLCTNQDLAKFQLKHDGILYLLPYVVNQMWSKYIHTAQMKQINWFKVFL